MNLQTFFVNYPKVAIAFSGGVDSAFLLHEAVKYGTKCIAYYVESDFQPAFEREDVKKIQKQLQVDLKILKVDILSYEEIRKNTEERCYFCKKTIFERILQEATQDGYEVLLDGTNASDKEEDRPGMKAIKELKVLSPLRICGLTKEKIRILSKEAGLFTWDKPAYTCLATRIPVNTSITKTTLSRTEKSEDFLRTLGFRDFRVRNMENGAKIQVTKEDMQKVFEHRERILNNFSLWYPVVTLDLEERK